MPSPALDINAELLAFKKRWELGVEVFWVGFVGGLVPGLDNVAVDGVVGNNVVANQGLEDVHAVLGEEEGRNVPGETAPCLVGWGEEGE